MLRICANAGRHAQRLAAHALTPASSRPRQLSCARMASTAWATVFSSSLVGLGVGVGVGLGLGLGLGVGVGLGVGAGAGLGVGLGLGLGLGLGEGLRANLGGMLHEECEHCLRISL